MKKTKIKKDLFNRIKEIGSENKVRGITLISLVITIIILLILAGITIATLTNSGLFEKSKTAKEVSQNAQDDEDMKISEYGNMIETYLNGGRTEPFNGIYITKRWNDGKNWYTVYSDGWVEQGGFIEGGSAVKTINLHVKFANTNYNVQCTSNYSSTDQTVYHPHVSDLNLEYFKSSSYGERGSSINTTGVPVYWRAEGYGDTNAINNLQ